MGKWLSYEEAKLVIHSLGFKKRKEWREYSCTARQKNIPSNPTIYEEWGGWTDWLGTDIRNFYSYEECQKYSISNGIKTKKEYGIHRIENKRLPSSPRTYYKEWIGWGDFLTTGNISNKVKKDLYASYIESKIILKKLNLSSYKDFIMEYKSGNIPSNIPYDPRRFYGDNFISFGDWLGNGNISNGELSKLYPNYENFLKILKENNIRYFTEYIDFVNISDILLPSQPHTFYNKKISDMFLIPKSNGEVKIENILKSKGVKYESEKRFKDCRDSLPLPFDFYLPEYNTCIEFDGEQHHKVVEYYGGIDYLKDRIKKDKIKTNWCDKNDIKLLRISYDKIDDIDDILSDYFIISF